VQPKVEATITSSASAVNPPEDVIDPLHCLLISLLDLHHSSNNTALNKQPSPQQISAGSVIQTYKKFSSVSSFDRIHNLML
jgi:hypothetical protein